MTQRSESGSAANGTPTTMSYDANGMEASNTTPGENLSGLEYGAEGERLGLLADGVPYQYMYNVRGELKWWPQASGLPTIAQARYANGAQIVEPYMGNNTGFWWDDRMGVMGAEFPPNSVDQWVYDNAGRLTYGGGDSFSETRSYDAENHTISSTSTGAIQLQGGGQYNYGLQNVIAWGPSRHPILIGASTSGAPSQSDTLHWNGDTLLFTTSSTGQLVDIKIGAQGDILPLDPSYKGLTFYDRDPAGGVMGCHNATGATYAGIADVYTRTSKSKYLGGVTYGVSPCETGSGYNQDTGSPTMPTSIIWWSQAVWSLGGSYAPPPVGQGGVLGMPRTDGLTDATDTIQGVRTYDSNAGTWTTPDAYAGEVDDPASQKSYMWNGSNPEAYGDPSGFDASVQQTGPYSYNIRIPVVWDPRVSREHREGITKAIETFWSRKVGKYTIRVAVVGPISGTNTNYITDQVSASYRSNVIDSRWMQINMKQSDSGWVAAHEGGHLMKLPDEYRDVGVFSIANAGYGSDVMGARDQTGVKESQIVEIILNNLFAPDDVSPFGGDEEADVSLTEIPPPETEAVPK